MLSRDRYQRHLSLPEVGLIGQQRLAQSRVLIVGAGGLGSPLIAYLAAAGVGTLGIIDDDVIALSNLQRQVIYRTADVGLLKVDMVKRFIHDLNPEVSVALYPVRLSRENARGIFQDYDVIADASDNFETRYVVNDICVSLQKPYVYAGISQFQGQCSVFGMPDRACYRCLYPTAESALIPNCADAGVLGVLPGIMGSVQAAQVLLCLLNQGEPLIGKLWCCDARTMQTQLLKLSRDPDCKVCHYDGQVVKSVLERVAMIEEMSVETLKRCLDEQVDIQLLDVREPHERAVSHIGGCFIPLKTLPDRITELDSNKRTVVYCRSGGRSLSAAQYLQAHGFSDVLNLKGGMLAWDAAYLS